MNNASHDRARFIMLINRLCYDAPTRPLHFLGITSLNTRRNLTAVRSPEEKSTRAEFDGLIDAFEEYFLGCVCGGSKIYKSYLLTSGHFTSRISALSTSPLQKAD